MRNILDIAAAPEIVLSVEPAEWRAIDGALGNGILSAIREQSRKMQRDIWRAVAWFHVTREKTAVTAFEDMDAVYAALESVNT